MKKLSSFVLAALLFVSTLLFVTPNASAQTTSPITYGKTYNIQNGYSSWGGGYLDTNGAGCEGNLYCVSTAKTPNRANANTGTWKILSATGQQNGTPVLCSDDIYLQNLYAGDGGYLDTNGAGCEGNKYCVSTAKTPNRANANTGTWRIISDACTDGIIHENESLHLRNGYDNMNGGFLDTNSVGCEGNLYCVSTSATWNRASGSGTNEWRFIAQRSEAKEAVLSKVVIFAAANFGGASQELGVGTYDFKTLSSGPVGNDSLSSLKVPAGYKVTLYEADFSGRTKTFTSDASFVDDFNDITSSIKVERI